MLALETTAPSFNLPDTVSGQHLSLESLEHKNGLVVAFICNHCPYVVLINEKLVEVAKEYMAKGIAFIAISSNDVENYPQDGPELMHQHAIEQGYPFPYLFDESQEVAKAYQAACTPDFYLFDSTLKLKYRGQFDDARPGNQKAVTGDDLKQAMDCLLQNKPLDFSQKPSLGCNIKWK